MFTARLTLFVAFLGSVVSGCKQSREATELAPVSGPTPQPTKSVEPPAQTRAAAPQPPSPPEGMVYVPGGSFDMGPPHAVTLGKDPERTQVAPFFLDRTEVTVAAYLTCARGGGCAAPIHQTGCNAAAKKPLVQHPMNCITKKQAEQYCAAQGKRLPSAPEWEFAARGTDGRVYPWGNAPPGEQLCWQGRAGAQSKTTCPVGSFPQGASPFGAVDMAGNVAEWTSTPETETAAAGAFRARGGSYALEPIDLSSPETLMVRADQWETFSADDASPRLGVRCAKSL